MKLLKLIGNLNQIEKSSFLKILDSLSNKVRESNKEVNAIISNNNAQIKNVDDENIVKLFFAVRLQYKQFIKEQLDLNNSQLSLICSILTRDGNSIMSRDWLQTLYKNDINKLETHINEYKASLSEGLEVDSTRARDYDIFRRCVAVAFTNDSMFNRENTVSRSEKTILNELGDALDLSNDEKQLIYFSQVPIKTIETDDIISLIKDSGIAFYSKRNLCIYVPDEIVQLLRELQGIMLPNKYFRRILRQLTDAQINRICKAHGLNSRVGREQKIVDILQSGISLKNSLLKDIYSNKATKNEVKKFISSLIKKLDITLKRKGATAEEKLDLLIYYFNSLESDDEIAISLDGFDCMLRDMTNIFPDLSERLKKEFELQQDNVLDTQLLLDYCIKPLDIIYLFSTLELTRFCKEQGIKQRGLLHQNIISNYRNQENLYLENIDLISSRNMNALKEKGLKLKESEVGAKFEELTSRVFCEFGFRVDNELRDRVNTSKNKIDLLVYLGNNKVIIIECKTAKNKFYNKYSSVSRQLNSYVKLCKHSGLDVTQVILVANDFSDSFIDACEDHFDLHLTLINAKALMMLLNAFRQSKYDTLPLGILQKGGFIDGDRICKSLLR